MSTTTSSTTTGGSGSTNKLLEQRKAICRRVFSKFAAADKRSTTSTVQQQKKKTGEEKNTSSTPSENMTINIEDFGRLCMEMGFELSPEELILATLMVDSSGDGVIEYSEFESFWLSDSRFDSLRHDPAELEWLSDALEMFMGCVDPQTNAITRNGFHQLHQQLNDATFEDVQDGEGMKVVKKKYKVGKEEEDWKVMDIDSSGTVSFNEFVSWLRSSQQQQQQQQQEQQKIVEKKKQKNGMKETFEKYDKDSSGTVDSEEFEVMCKDLFGGDMSESEVEMAMMLVDTDGSGTIEFEEFEEFWNQKAQFEKLRKD